MSLYLEEIPLDNPYSFRSKIDILPHIVVPWHYHPDIEILLITKGKGRRFVGDHVENFNQGDLCIIGSNLPHVWKSEPSYYEDNSTNKAECMVIHFRKELFGDLFWQLPEMIKTSQFLEESKRGIRFKGTLRKRIEKQIKEAFTKSHEERLTCLLNILHTMSSANEYKHLASSGFSTEVQSNDGLRFQKVIEFVASNYQRPILLEEVAEQIHLSPTAFCRYFKERTGKSFLQYLNQYRIGLARKLLIDSQMKIQEIAFECGFGNLSHFNKHFKKLTGVIPKIYREEHKKTHHRLLKGKHML